jgi:ACS family tartrate transporter-like MFS transporter
MNGIEERTMSKVSWRLLPYLVLCYFVAFLDRVNIGFAGPGMVRDLGFTAEVFGGAAGIFFLTYFIFEVPSNLALERFGASRWIARIMVSWGIVSGAQAFVTGATSLNVIRLILGIAEAGFFPGIIFYLTLWFPSSYRARIIGSFMFAIPLSTAIGSPISGFILHLEGVWGLHGWQWLFLLEGFPSLILGVVTWFYLTDRPAKADWLADDERRWLQDRLAAEQKTRESKVRIAWRQTLFNPRVIGLAFVYMSITVSLYGLSFFLPQIVKAFGTGDIASGFIVAFPYAIGAICMLLWGRFSDRIKERKWTTIFPLVMIAVGLVAAAYTDSLTGKILAVSIGAFGVFSAFAVFWTLPTAFLSGTAAAAGIAWINSVGNLGGYFGPKVFGYLKDTTHTDFYGMLFFAAFAVVGAALVLIMGHDIRLELPAGSVTQAE